METISQSFGFISQISLPIPLTQIFFFALVCSVFLIIGKHKIGLLVSYAFTFYWAFVLNRAFLIKQFEPTTAGKYIYGIFGMVMALIAFVGVIKRSE
ncbi:MAG: hypothetical protein ACE5E9_13050 [Nitrospinaceae bacterium]